MSLTDILEDIKDNVTNIETLEKNNISTKNTINSDSKEMRHHLSIHRLSQEALEKVNTMFNLLILKDNIANMPRIDRNIALEVFTMLPNISKVEEAKLTSSPSIMNKEIIEKVFRENIDNKLNGDILNRLSELKTLIESHLPEVDNLINYFKTFMSTVESKVEHFKKAPPSVIEYNPLAYKEQNQERHLINLYTEKIVNILSIDDTKLEYEKYSGNLVKMFKEIYFNETLDDLYKTFSYLPPKDEVSLSSIVEYVYTAISNLERYRKDFENYIVKFNAINSEEVELNEDVVSLVNSYNDIASKVEVISRLKVITENKNNCFEKAVEIIYNDS